MSRDLTDRELANKAVQLSPRDLADAKRLLALLTREASDPETIDPAGHCRHDLRGVYALISRAREILAERRRRYELFGKGMFGEPAWEILLLLYVLESGPRLTLSRLAELSGASKSTALRWLDYLESQHWIRREPHPTDKRSAFVELTEIGRARLEAYLSDTPAL